MKRLMIGLAVAVAIGSGCDANTLSRLGVLKTGPSVDPSPQPSIAVSPSPEPSPSPSSSSLESQFASRLDGRFTFLGGDPGIPLTGRLKGRVVGGSIFESLERTAQTDAAGRYTIDGLREGDYQLVWDDGGIVAADAFNTAGVAVSDPVPVTASQSAAASRSLELAWDFTAAVPQPNATLASRDIVFSWGAKTGVSAPVYQVLLYDTSDISRGAVAASAPSASTTATLAFPDSVGAGIRYYVVKYWKSGGSYGGANYYGTTRPIPVKVPAP